MTTFWRCLLWVQSLLGTGHLRRALLLAEALATRGAAVVLVNGGPTGPWPVPAGVELVQLPAVTAKRTDFGSLIDETGAPVSPALRAARRERLLDLFRTIRPQAVVTEMFPFGRRAFRDELLPLLEAAREQRPCPIVAASVRDVLVSKPDPARYRWMAELTLAHYDRVLVHGDERLLPFAASFPLAASLGERVVHTGFVRPILPQAEVLEAPAVLVSAGGGAVGERLLRTALAARSLTRLRDGLWLLAAGQNLPEVDFAALRAEADPGCTIVRWRDDLGSLMGCCRVSVSQAGYNTVVEGLTAGARMVLVPFASGNEDEQTRRARRLEELGLAELVEEDRIEPRALAAAIDRAAARPRPAIGYWSFDGAARSAAILAALVEERHGVGAA
ncbi:glycosyltransferase family protein [Benzoatithermus flavus]|uniref:Glycosyltransferase n=1 Tax=Benzoatithermus flavus TaxID=3108223 RepID=A0ABU8XQI6_9PROT